MIKCGGFILIYILIYYCCPVSSEQSENPTLTNSCLVNQNGALRGFAFEIPRNLRKGAREKRLRT